MYGEPVLITGTAGATFVRVPILNKRGVKSFAYSITIKCNDAANDMVVSLDGGTTSIPVLRTDLVGITINGPIHEFSVKRAAGANATYTAVAAVA